MNDNKLNSLNFQAILDGIDDGIFISDIHGNILMVNKAVEKTGGKKMNDLIGRNIEDLKSEGYCSEFVTKKVLETQKKETIVQKLSSGREIVVTGIPYFENGQLTMVIACERDITELMMLQERITEVEAIKDRYEHELAQLKLKAQGERNVVYASEGITKVMLLAQKLAAIDSTVLIQGESGVGKEVIADQIYEKSSRKGQPYVKVNCGAIPDNLIESEMFGYEAGAFTGALKTGKLGYFELANGGTIFLDEIGELPLSMQVKLLRVIQERNILRVGGIRSTPLDIRIIAATNKKLKEMVKKGEFRQDLYYRLSVTTINVPPLRERKEDIITLAKHFLDKYSKKYNLKHQISLKAMKFLLNYDWPGNVRELENLLESLVITAENETIYIQDVAEYLFDDKIDEEASAMSLYYSGSLTERVEYFEKQLLEEAYRKYGDTAVIAEVMGTTRSTINRKLKRYCIR